VWATGYNGLGRKNPKLIQTFKLKAKPGPMWVAGFSGRPESFNLLVGVFSFY